MFWAMKQGADPGESSRDAGIQPQNLRIVQYALWHFACIITINDTGYAQEKNVKVQSRKIKSYLEFPGTYFVKSCWNSSDPDFPDFSDQTARLMPSKPRTNIIPLQAGQCVKAVKMGTEIMPKRPPQKTSAEAKMLDILWSVMAGIMGNQTTANPPTHHKTLVGGHFLVGVNAPEQRSNWYVLPWNNLANWNLRTYAVFAACWTGQNLTCLDFSSGGHPESWRSVHLCLCPSLSPQDGRMVMSYLNWGPLAFHSHWRSSNIGIPGAWMPGQMPRN